MNQLVMLLLSNFLVNSCPSLLQDDKRTRTAGSWSDEALCRLWFTKMPLWGLLVSSTYNIVALTVERFLAVVYPFHYRAWCTRRRASPSSLLSIAYLLNKHVSAIRAIMGLVALIAWGWTGLRMTQ